MKVKITIDVEDKTTYHDIVEQFYNQMDKWLKANGDEEHGLIDGLFLFADDFYKSERKRR